MKGMDCGKSQKVNKSIKQTQKLVMKISGA
jgi:hypothetical protein